MKNKRGLKTKDLWKNPLYRKHMSETHTKNSLEYSALHKWVTKSKTKPNQCEKCGKINCELQWANIDNKYRRVLADYMALCISCHSLYDRKKHGKHSESTKKIYSKFNGVSYNKSLGYWIAQLKIKGRHIVKYSKTEKEAAIEYNVLAEKYHGTFAKLNPV